MRVEILSTGNELLRGRNVDAHLAWLARTLEPAGLEVRHHQTVGDDLGRLVDAIKLAAARADVVLLTGGLGPTEDDHTREAAAKAFHRPLGFRRDVWKEIRARFRHHRVKMASINRRQAFAPKGAVVLPNPNGSAPGFFLRQDGVFFAALPGPSGEMQPMFLRRVLPVLRPRRRFDLWEAKCHGIPEASIDEVVGRLVGKKAAYGLTASGGQITISIRAEGPRRKKILRELSRRVRSALGDHLYEGELAETVARMLIRSGKKIAVAESCTGGLIAHRLTNVAGVSDVLCETLVTYSNESKIRRLGVPRELIVRHGAVSEEVARAMALGVARTSGADLGVAVTGIAGPTGGTPSKPVGLCYMAVNDRVERRIFPGNRRNVKLRAAGYALNMVRLWMLKEQGHARKKVGLRAHR